jgi:AmiR/NasT family two-component response regulator
VPDQNPAFTDTVARDGAGSDDVARLREENANLLKAVESRDLIGQAKGILMERQKLSASEAFDALRVASQHSNQKLVEIARLLAETGEWPLNGNGNGA